MSHDAWPTTRLSLLLQVKDPHAEEAWDEFVRRYRPPMLQLIENVFHLQQTEAEDVAQDVLIKLLRAMQGFRYDPRRKFRAWLRTVTRNAVRDTLRSRKVRRDQATGDSHVKRMLDAHPTMTDEFADTLTNQMYCDILSDAERIVKQRVEDRTWQAYEASREGKWSAREIATELDMTTAAVYKAKSKVLKMIREAIAAAMTHS